MKNVAKKNNKGFSLVELIVVVLIIGVLGVALAPQIMKWVDTSKKNADINNAGILASAVQAAVAEWQGAGGSMSSQTATAEFTVSGEGVCSTVTGHVWGAPAATGAKALIDYLDENMSAGYPISKFDAEGFYIKVETSGKVTVYCNADDKNPLPTP